MNENTRQQSGLGIAGMIIGIISLLLSCVFIGGILGIIGLILSIVGATRKNKAAGTAIAGITLNTIAIFIMIIVMAIGAGADSGENNIEGENREMSAQAPSNIVSDPLSDDIIDVDISDCHVKYVSHEVVENRSGDKCLAVYYDFTNNSDETENFSFTITDKAFQNGLELETSFFHVNDDSKNRSAEIKPGVTIRVCSGFVLRDETADIELEVSEWITLKDEPEDKMVLSIK